MRHWRDRDLGEAESGHDGVVGERRASAIEHHHGVLGQFGEGALPRTRQRVIIGDRGVQLLVEQLDRLHEVRVHLSDDPDVEPPLAHVVDDAGRRQVRHGQVETVAAAHELRDEAPERGGDRADPERNACAVVCRPLCPQSERGEALQDVEDLGVEGVGNRRGLDLAGAAREELDAPPALERLDRVADRRLRHVEFARGGGEAALLVDGTEIAELVQLWERTQGPRGGRRPRIRHSATPVS